VRLRPLSLVLHRCCTATRGRSLGHRTARTGSVDMTRLCDTVRSLNESMPSEAALPGFDPDLAHGEVLHVCGGQGSRDPNCCRSDETVGLVQCGSRCGKVAAPGSGEAAFGDAERKQSYRMPIEGRETVLPHGFPRRGGAHARSPRPRWRIPTAEFPGVASRRPGRRPGALEARR
jgi:hypothetical protein